MKIATIIGARPQFIKAAAVSRAIAEHNRISGISGKNEGLRPFLSERKMGAVPVFLTGADRDRIVTAVRSFKPHAAHPPLYGDGKAAAHCLRALLERY